MAYIKPLIIALLTLHTIFIADISFSEDFGVPPGGNGLFYLPEEEFKITLLNRRRRPELTFGFGAHGGSFGGGTDLPMNELLKIMRKNIQPSTKVIFMETCDGKLWAPEIASSLNKPVLAPNDTLYVRPFSKTPSYVVAKSGMKNTVPAADAFSIYYPDGRMRPVNGNAAMRLFKNATYTGRGLRVHSRGVGAGGMGGQVFGFGAGALAVAGWFGSANSAFGEGHMGEQLDRYSNPFNIIDGISGHPGALINSMEQSMNNDLERTAMSGNDALMLEQLEYRGSGDIGIGVYRYAVDQALREKKANAGPLESLVNGVFGWGEPSYEEFLEDGNNAETISDLRKRRDCQ